VVEARVAVMEEVKIVLLMATVVVVVLVLWKNWQRRRASNYYLTLLRRMVTPAAVYMGRTRAGVLLLMVVPVDAGAEATGMAVRMVVITRGC
jgi:hypothetical protein